VQGRRFEIRELQKALVVACGGYLSETYFRLMDTEISEVLYHIEVYRDVQARTHPELNAEGKLNAWGMSGVEFE
jgi:hypothetical protein